MVLPPGGPLFIAIVGLALWRQRPRLARAFAAVGVITLLALSLPIISTLLAFSFSAPEPFDVSRTSDARAIVILGGGTRTNAPEFGGDTLGRLTLERVRYGARIARETKLPLLVTGGSVGAITPEAVLMRDALAQEYGINARWVEQYSLNTHQNARYSSALLAAEGITTVVLVTHAFDVPRATAEFRASGIATIPAPTGVPRLTQLEATDFLPSISALEVSYYNLYEILAFLVFTANHVRA
jgi:uncharacterized SAM-binding protein YcdF (DUF218 family)